MDGASRDEGRNVAATARKSVEEFLAQHTLALVGISRGGRGFGNVVLRELTARGYKVLPVHPEAREIDGQRCWPGLSDLPEPVGGLVIVLPPSQTLRVLTDALAAGIRRVWMQQGSDSPLAVRFCREHGIQAVRGECLLMFANPGAFPHNVHRGIWRLLGKLPK
jgi:uncharacterized protein